MRSVMPEGGIAEQQFAFAAYIRDPEAHPLPDKIEPRRMAIYRELFFNNVEGFLASGFPVIRKIFNDQQWHALAQDFFAHHKSQTPYFSEISEEFLAFLEHQRSNQNDPPFLLELAHYEWVEMALSIAFGEPPERDQRLLDDPLSQPLAVSELAWPLAYRFPVHKISPDQQPTEPPDQPTCLVLYRDHSDEVHFLEINSVTYRLLQLLQEQPGRSGRALMVQIAEEINHPDPGVVIDSGAALLSDLAQRGVIRTEQDE